MYRTFIGFIASFLFISLAEGRWQVNSDFELHLTESTFDRVVEDFWENLKGKQIVELGNLTVDQGIPISIQGIHAEVDYAFNKPVRTVSGRREWSLVSEGIGARLLIDHISATQIIERDIGGVIVRIRLDADCRNVVLHLPPGLTKVAAKIRAEVAQSQVQLTLPEFFADWQAGAWQVDRLSCTGAQGFDQLVAQEALKALGSYQNFDSEVRTMLSDRFKEWSKDISILLLSERELPSKRDYLKIYYQPHEVQDSSEGLVLKGEMHFEYPYISPQQDIVHEYRLEKTVTVKQQATSPQLLMPFSAVRSLMMGEYFAGKLEYSLRSYEIPAFHKLMQSRWKQFFGWPDLMSFAKNTTFFFQFFPMGPPSFTEEFAGADGAISGELSLPLAIRMYAPLENTYKPYVEFRTLVLGHTNLRLLGGGKVQFQVQANGLDVNYKFARAYEESRSPSTYIAVGTMAEAAREALSLEGFELVIPAISIGKSVKLSPEKWNLEKGALRLDFTTGR